MTVLVLSAFISETSLLMRKHRAEEIAEDRGKRLYRAADTGIHLLFGVTGEGKTNVRKFFEWYGAKAGTFDLPGLVVSTGYAGALKKELKAGKTILADSVTDLSSGKYFRLETPSAPGIKAIRADGLTVDRLTDSAAKIAVAQQKPDAYFVDMESSAVAEFCAVRRIPLWIVRSISDPLGFRFPGKEFAREDHCRIPARRWLAAVLKDPAEFIRAMRLQLNLRKSRKRIASVVGQVLAGLGTAAEA